MNERRAHAAPSWVLALTSFASAMIALDSLVVTTALSTIRRDLGASIEQLEWTVNAYILCFAVMLMTGSVLGDRFGRRRFFALGVAIFSVASAACALSPAIGWLIAMRALQGIGAALVMPLAMTLLSAAYPPEQRARALGLFSGLTGLALLIGPVVGGAVAQGLTWHWIFWINVPLGLVLIPLILTRIPESYGPGDRLDMPGLLLITGSSVGLVWGVVRGNVSSWSSPEIVASFASGVLLAAGFVIWERRAPQPMLPLCFFASRPFALGNLASVFLYAAVYGTLFFIPQYLQAALGFDPFTAGLHLLPWTAPVFLVAPLAGASVNRVGARPLVAGGLLLQAIGMGWIAVVAALGLDYLHLLPPLVLAGAGVSMAMPAAQSAVLGAVARSDVGKASGAFNMLRYLGGAFGVAIAVAAFSRYGSNDSPQAFSAGFAPAIAVTGFLSLLGGIAGLGLHEQRSLAAIPAHA